MKQPINTQQQGAVLVISMIILLLLTVLAVTSMQTSTLEERMAGNTRDRQLALAAAEAGLKDAEDFLLTVAATGFFDTDGSDGLYDDSYQEIWNTVDWDGDPTGSTGYKTGTLSGGDLAAPPKYVIQHIITSGTEEDRTNLGNYDDGTGAGRIGLFRVTSRGTGTTTTSAVVLQTVVGVGNL